MHNLNELDKFYPLYLSFSNAEAFKADQLRAKKETTNQFHTSEKEVDWPLLLDDK